jgi:hypothetical protein
MVYIDKIPHQVQNVEDSQWCGVSGSLGRWAGNSLNLFLASGVELDMSFATYAI